MSVTSVEKSATKPGPVKVTKLNGHAKPKAKKAKPAAKKPKAKKAKANGSRGSRESGAALLALVVANLNLDADDFVKKARAKGIKGSDAHTRGVFNWGKRFIAAYKAR